jgi:hypothetical protein
MTKRNMKEKNIENGRKLILDAFKLIDISGHKKTQTYWSIFQFGLWNCNFESKKRLSHNSIQFFIIYVPSQHL